VSSVSYFPNKNVNRMATHPVYILKKIVNRMEGIRFNHFFFKTEGHFYRDNFDILKTYGGAGREYWGAERIRPRLFNKIMSHMECTFGIFSEKKKRKTITFCTPWFMKVHLPSSNL